MLLHQVADGESDEKYAEDKKILEDARDKLADVASRNSKSPNGKRTFSLVTVV